MIKHRDFKQTHFPQPDGTMLVKTLGCDGGGYYAEVYTDDDGASGHGDDAKIGHFYAPSIAELEALDPATVPLEPMRLRDAPDPFDLACERRFD